MLNIIQKPPDFSGGLAAWQGVSDFTQGAALIFMYGLFQYNAVPSFKLLHKVIILL